MNWEQLYSKHTASMGQSLIRELVSSIKGIPGLISFAGGFPAAETFPKKELAEIFRDIVEEEGDNILQYGSSEGDSSLKEEIRKWEGIKDLQDEQILITVGSTNGIYYFSRSLIDEGDVILCEAPTFLGSLVAFESTGAEVIGIPMDENGLLTEKLENQIAEIKDQGKKIKFIYTIPEFQNPTGISMNLERRKQLLEIAKQNNIPVLEDNPYGELRFSGEKITDLYKLDLEKSKNIENVICVKSYSKVLGPGLRLAYVIGPKEIIGKMSSWAQKVNISPDCVTQRVVARFLAENRMQPHIDKISAYYQPKCKKMLESLEKYMPENISWTKPEGGMFVWIYLPEKIDGDVLFEKAKEKKVAFISGSKFYPENINIKNEIRLNYSYPSMEQIEEGVKRLAELIKEMM